MAKVLFVASEAAPIAKVGGLGDIIGSLPKALSKIGVEVKIALPFYEVINRRLWQPKLIFNLDEETSVYKTKLPKSNVEVFLIYNERFLSRGPVYFERTAFVGSNREIERFLFFSKTVFQLLRHPKFWKPDIVHCHDWHTGALVKEIKNWRSEIKPKTVFTIHNLANQGKWAGGNLMAEGILSADKITTVSPSYAEEILTKKYGERLEGLLGKRKKDLIGILNGLDYAFWPLPQRPWRKAYKNRSPIFGFVARLTYQKGLDLILPLTPRLVEKEKVDFYFLGQGEARYERALSALAEKYPKNVQVKIDFDEKLAHKIYAQSDFFLMPSLFEPSGLGQMISMHYGTIPIVRSTGGLKDTVEHLKTGFVFEQFTAGALLSALKLAIKYFQSPKDLEVIRRNCLEKDFSWGKSAKKYKAVYNSLVQK